MIKSLSEAIKKSHGRDLRVDFFRGLAQWIIFVDHIPGNWLSAFTLQSFLLCDATEIFVFLSGYSAGQVYGSMIDHQKWKVVASSLMRRVRSLYNTHLLLFMLILIEVGIFSTTADLQPYLQESGLAFFLEEPRRAFLRLLTLQFQPAFLDILPLYMILLLSLALALPLLKRPVLLLSIALMIYLGIRVTNTNLPTSQNTYWFLNPLAWQFLFFIGCVLGCPKNKFYLPRSRYLLLASFVVVLVSSVIYLTLPTSNNWIGLGLNFLLDGIESVDKTGLHPMRLVTALALMYLVSRLVPMKGNWTSYRVAAPFILMGQHGLPVFSVGILLAVIGRFAIEYTNNWPTQILINSTGLAILILTALTSAHSKFSYHQLLFIARSRFQRLRNCI